MIWGGGKLVDESSGNKDPGNQEVRANFLLNFLPLWWVRGGGVLIIINMFRGGGNYQLDDPEILFNQT